MQAEPPSDERVRSAGVLEVPLHRALGVRFIDPESPGSGIELEVVELARNNVGILHGGIAAALLDVAAYLAVVPELEPGTNAVTVSSSVSQLRPVGAGESIRFEGEVTRRGRSLAFCRSCALHDGRVFATAEIVKSIVRD